MKLASSFILVFLMIVEPVFATDLAKEKRWADQVVDAILDGDAVWLNDGSNDFLTIYTEAEDASDKAVIIMHGTGIHPDWQQVVQPLRVGLTEHGWHTLSIQMPILANEAEHIEYAPLYDEVAPRADASIAYLREQGVKKVVIIGHSQGAAMAAYYLSNSTQKIDGFIAIGIANSEADKRMNSTAALQTLKLPLLDLYGKEDLEDITKSADARRSAAETAGNTAYSQQVIPGNHFYEGHDDELVETVANWLTNL